MTPYDSFIKESIAVASVALIGTYITCPVYRYLIQPQLYETGNYCSDLWVLRKPYQNLSLLQKTIREIAGMCLGALSNALISAGIGGIYRIFSRKCTLALVGKFAMVGAIAGAFFCVLWEPGIHKRAQQLHPSKSNLNDDQYSKFSHKFI